MPHANVSPLALDATRQLANFSGLFHDVGKMTRHFQNKLNNLAIERDAISHEWISAWMLAHMLNHDALHWDGFLAAWADWEGPQGGVDTLASNYAWRPFSGLDSFDTAALMVVATHHRLFSTGDRRNKFGKEHKQPPDAGVVSPGVNHMDSFSVASDRQIWHRPEKWLPNKAEATRWQRLLQQGDDLRRSSAMTPLPHPVAHWHKVGLIARAAMVLADQHVSARIFSDEADAPTYGKTKKAIRANSAPKNQPLTWHLHTVGHTASDYVDLFGAQALPMLAPKTRRALHGDEAATPISMRFAWQDHACAFMRQLAQNGPAAFLIFNVASTGSGKTRANVRVLEACRALDDPLRVTAGFNLKALTLQTAHAYRQELGLNQNECACVIGDSLARALHLFEQQDDEDANPTVFTSTGCDSETFLRTLPEWVSRLDKGSGDRTQATLVAAPVLVATMDYLVAAGDPTQQAHHAQALLRIAHSDLLIDEADSYDPEGLVAVLRVVQMAGMFGRNVVVSSATLSAVLAEQIERAWQSGMAMYQADGASTLQAHAVLISNQGDITGRQVLHSQEPFPHWYRNAMADLYRPVPDAPVHRLCQIEPVAKAQSLCATLETVCLKGHAHHGWFAQTQSRTVQVSIGVIRMANVGPLMEMAEELAIHPWPENTAVKICPYHGREVSVRRAWKEQALDKLLKRHGDPDLSQHPLLEQQLDGLPAHVNNLVLIVLASPVEEVGRDHDFDWTVIEPSSMHAIIQLAGRVNRHRLKYVTMPNVFLLQWNVQKLKGNAHCFHHPGLQQIDKSERPCTHRNANAFKLMEPVMADGADMTQPFALDAGLIFNPERRCHFADEDDRAIALILGDVPSFFDPEHGQWACDWFYVKYPLRNRQQDETWQAIPLATGQLQLKKYERNHAGEPWVLKNSRTTEQRPDDESRQWLCPSVSKAARHLRNQLTALYGAEHSQTSDFMTLAQQFSIDLSGNQEPAIHWAGVEKLSV